jgi:hypothetical protein
MYSVSVEDVATVDWRFDDHEIGPLDRKNMYSDIDFPSPRDEDPAQSESIEAVSVRVSVCYRFL